MREWLKQHHVFIVILISGTALRFLSANGFEFHHDELSALLRTRFDSFNALIENGVSIDGHPGFTQVWLWLWTAVFGYDPFIVKLPFMLSGIFSIWLIYAIGKALFGKQSGLLASALFAVLQYGIIYAQWARPYALAMVFMLAAFYSLILFAQRSSKRLLIIYAICSALTAYTHYFALLQLIVLSVGWFFVVLNKSQKLWIIVGGLTAFVLWSPHLSITLKHLSIGGIGYWLQLPEPDYWIQLIAFSFDYSWLVASPLVLLGVVSLLSVFRFPKNVRIIVLLTLAWIVPYLVAYFYSTQVNALMHFGTMFFTFPMLLLAIAGLMSAYHRSVVKLVVFWVLLFGSYVLLERRHHVALNTVTEFQDPFNWYQQLKAENPEIIAMFDLRVDMVEFLNHNGLVSANDVALVEHFSEGQLNQEFFAKLNTNDLLLVTNAGSKLELLGNALVAFPVVKQLHCYQAATCYWLSKTGRPNGHNENQLEPLEAMNGREYGQVLGARTEIMPGWNNLFVHGSCVGSAFNEVQLVLHWQPIASDSTEFWRGSALKPFANTNQIQNVGVVVDLRDLSADKGQLNTYFWNPQKESFTVKSIHSAQYPSNPLRYGLFESIECDPMLNFEKGVGSKTPTTKTLK